MKLCLKSLAIVCLGWLAGAVALAAETDIKGLPAGWTAVAPRDEIKPIFRYEAKGGPEGREAFIIAGDNLFDEPLTESERGLTPEQLRQKHILEDVEKSQSEAYDVAKQETETGRGRRQTGKVGAGMKAKPKHHVFPQEHEEFFRERGFRGNYHIDNFTVELDEAAHQAVHGGGNYQIGRTTKFEWNTRVMDELKGAETKLGRKLTREEIFPIVERLMKEYKIPRRYVEYK